MREDYMPNEKYRNMFGVERNGYGMERVDLYLAQLEVAFKKIREDNRSLKRELSEQQAMQPPAMGLMDGESGMRLAAQEQYIAQLQAQLAEQQEQNQRLLAQMSESGIGQPPVDDLVDQIAALRTEADELRQQLRRQTGYGQQSYPYGEAYPDPRQDLIGKVLVEARATAEDVKRTAKQEADQTLRKARQQVDELRTERERIYTQLQGISYALRNALRETGDIDYKQRGEEFAAG